MFALVIAAAIRLQNPIAVPAFGTWDGKSWAGISFGVGEKDLKKQVRTSKTVGPDPASIRIAVDKKDWIVAGILTDVNERGSVAGFTIDIEREQPIESLEALQQELGPPDLTAFPNVRYSDWGLAVWKGKGIIAVVKNGSRPLVQKVLLAAPTTIVQNLDLWDREPNRISGFPRMPVRGFDVSVSCDPRDEELEKTCDGSMRRAVRRLMESYDGVGWQPASDGARIQVSFRTNRKSQYSIVGSASVTYQDPLGTVSVTEPSNDTVRRDVEVVDRCRSMFDDLVVKLAKDVDARYRRLAWQAEWRPFTALARPKP